MAPTKPMLSADDTLVLPRMHHKTLSAEKGQRKPAVELPKKWSIIVSYKIDYEYNGQSYEVTVDFVLMSEHEENMDNLGEFLDYYGFEHMNSSDVAPLTYMEAEMNGSSFITGMSKGTLLEKCDKRSDFLNGAESRVKERDQNGIPTLMYIAVSDDLYGIDSYEGSESESESDSSTSCDSDF